MLQSARFLSCKKHFTKWLSKDKPSELSGIIEADETYYRYSLKGCHHLPRESHRRGSDKAIRGLSKKQVCVFTACDRSNQDIEIIAGLVPCFISNTSISGNIK